MPHQGNSPADIIGYDGQGRPIYKGHNNGNGNNSNGVRRNGNNVNRNTRMRNGRAATRPTGRNMNNRTANPNPVTREFTAPQSPRYYRPNGQIVPVGAQLHQHQDGTIMTQHLRGGVMPDTSVVVTTTRPRMNNNRRRATTRARTGGMRNQPTTRTAANRMSQRPIRRGGRRTGGSY